MTNSDQPIDIIYGTVTGNAETLAERFSEQCEANGLTCNLSAAEDWPMERFAEQGRKTVFIISTWGDGEPPDDAIEFCEALYDQKVPVSHLHYVVVSLGDSAYDDFCGCGRRLDEALSQAGATRMMERVDLDVDFDDDFDAWVERFFSQILATS